MTEQPYVRIPNTTTPNTAGTPTTADIASDDTSGVGTGPFIQQVSKSISNRIWAQLVGWLGGAIDPGTGRLRVLVEQISFPQGQVTAPNVTLQSSTVTVTNISNATGSGNRPDTIIFDIMMGSWQDMMVNCIKRS